MSDHEGIYSRLKNHIPVLNKKIALIILIINIFFPGFGTMLLSCLGGKFNIEHIYVGACQFIFSICVMGWVWSILWGIIVVMKSVD